MRCMHMFVRICLSVRMHVCMHACMYGCLSVCLSVSVCMYCTYVCVCACLLSMYVGPMRVYASMHICMGATCQDILPLYTLSWADRSNIEMSKHCLLRQHKAMTFMVITTALLGSCV